MTSPENVAEPCTREREAWEEMRREGEVKKPFAFSCGGSSFSSLLKFKEKRTEEGREGREGGREGQRKTRRHKRRDE